MQTAGGATDVNQLVSKWNELLLIGPQDYFGPFAVRDSVETSQKRGRKDFPKAVGIRYLAKYQYGSGVEPYKA